MAATNLDFIFIDIWLLNDKIRLLFCSRKDKNDTAVCGNMNLLFPCKIVKKLIFPVPLTEIEFEKGKAISYLYRPVNQELITNQCCN